MRRTPLVPLRRRALPRNTVELARFLLGKVLVRQLPGGRAIGRIVETEAYLENDPACHAFRGRTPRNRSLFLDAGHAYVYVCYGTSYLLNVSSERAGIGAGVLLRALEPMDGAVLMHGKRPGIPLRDLARGPGRLTAALDVDLTHDGLDLCTGRGPLWLAGDGSTVAAIGITRRIGITKAADAPLRYVVAGSDYLSGTRRLNTSPPCRAPLMP